MACEFPEELPRSTPFVENNLQNSITPIPPPASYNLDRAILEALFSVANITVEGEQVHTQAILR
jgi:hypothetical protein